MKELRDFLKDTIRRKVDFSKTAQSQGRVPPPVEKPVPHDAVRIQLPWEDAWRTFGTVSLVDAVLNRRSRRGATRTDLTLLELSFLLWATQGVVEKELPYHALRVVPSAGCRHSFETYIAAIRIENLDKSIYRYLPLSHELIVTATYPDLEGRYRRSAGTDVRWQECGSIFLVNDPVADGMALCRSRAQSDRP